MENITKTTIEVSVLTPEDGFYLTQSLLKEGEDRIFSEKIFLAKDASESDWRIASQEEKDDYKI